MGWTGGDYLVCTHLCAYVGGSDVQRTLGGVGNPVSVDAHQLQYALLQLHRVKILQQIGVPVIFVRHCFLSQKTMEGGAPVPCCTHWKHAPVRCCTYQKTCTCVLLYLPENMHLCVVVLTGKRAPVCCCTYWKRAPVRCCAHARHVLVRTEEAHLAVHAPVRLHPLEQLQQRQRN